MKASVNIQKRPPKLKWLVAFLFLTCCQKSFSQNYNFKHYNIGDGLAQSQVLKIYRDDNSYLWLGTKSYYLFLVITEKMVNIWAGTSLLIPKPRWYLKALSLKTT